MIAIHHDETDELLGYVSKETSGWAARTIFRLVLTRTETKVDADNFVRNNGLRSLTCIWRYYDADDKAWFACKLLEVYETRVVVARTDELGLEDPTLYKRVTIQSPNETNLQLA